MGRKKKNTSSLLLELVFLPITFPFKAAGALLSAMAKDASKPVKPGYKHRRR